MENNIYKAANILKTSSKHYIGGTIFKPGFFVKSQWAKKAGSTIL